MSKQTATPELDLKAHYAVRNYRGFAFYLRGYVKLQVPPEIEGDEPEEVEDRSQVIAVMVGDDRKHIIEVDDLRLLGEDEFCHTCGQIGCGCDVREA